MGRPFGVSDQVSYKMRLCVSGLRPGEWRIIDCAEISPTQLAKGACNRMQTLIRKHSGFDRRYQFWCVTEHLFAVRRLSDATELAEADKSLRRDISFRNKLAEVGEFRSDLGELAVRVQK